MSAPQAWYNENDPQTAAWLRQLIVEGHIAPGVVDERSIVDVMAADLAGFAQCHFFAGIGGWSYALRLAGWPDDRPVWTGSCPCQPFSAAGKRKGFADDRHLWPVWRGLIENACPGIVFGEQVASATDWLRLVRGDMGAMGYIFAARPFEAASAGADHLRNRFGIVAYDPRQRRGEGWPEHEIRGWGDTVAGDGGSNGVGLADTDDPRSQGRPVHPERAGQRPPRQDGVANATGERPFSCTQREIHRGEKGSRPRNVESERHRGAFDVADTHESQRRKRNQQPTRQQPQHDETARACAVGNGTGISEREPDHQANPIAAEWQAWPVSGSAGANFEWAIGADGKARRVKSGVRLLVDAFPSRVGLLRGFGNAIDPEEFEQFILAAQEAIQDVEQIT